MSVAWVLAWHWKTVTSEMHPLPFHVLLTNLHLAFFVSRALHVWAAIAIWRSKHLIWNLINFMLAIWAWIYNLSYYGSIASQRNEVLQILSFCIGRGPLSQDLSRAHFILTYALPITPQLRGEVHTSLEFTSLFKQALHIHATCACRSFALAFKLAKLHCKSACCTFSMICDVSFLGAYFDTILSLLSARADTWASQATSKVLDLSWCMSRYMTSGVFCR